MVFGTGKIEFDTDFRMIQYVGDPFVDCGVAVLEHRIQKSCSDFTESDLREQAQWLEHEYCRKIWAGYLTVHFPNSGWCNATMSAAKKGEFRREVLAGFERERLGRACAYCGGPAHDLADRSKIPLLTGASSMVAGPNGLPGLPVCGYCLFAIQFYPLATLKVEGKPLFWWSADAQWLYLLTGEFVRTVGLIMAASSDAFPSLSWPSTRLMDAASNALERVLNSGHEIQLADVAGCHVTNYGSGPDYREFRLPKSLLEFWAVAKSFSVYSDIVESNWEAKPERKRARKAAADGETAVWQKRNLFYEDLGALLKAPEDHEARLSFAKKYFMTKGGPGRTRSYELARFFLERMAGMTRERLNAVERLSEQIADSTQWKDAVDKLFRAGNVITSLRDVQDRRLRKGEAPLRTADIYEAFDIVSDEDATARDGYFVRDLMLLKILEIKGEAALPEDESVVA